jgi:hypothetical protein
MLVCIVVFGLKSQKLFIFGFLNRLKGRISGACSYECLLLSPFEANQSSTVARWPNFWPKNSKQAPIKFRYAQKKINAVKSQNLVKKV